MAHDSRNTYAKKLYIGICTGKLVSGTILSSVIYVAAKISEYDSCMVMVEQE